MIIASRRYGKSSLALHALKLSHIHFSEIDFYMAHDEKNIEQYLLAGIADLIGKALGPIEKLTTSIKKYVKNLKPKIELDAGPLKLELTTEQTSDPATNIKEALLMLEQLLAEHKKHAVLLLDEFQTVGVIAEGKGIEAAIQHVAQKTRYLTIIFSGSQRRLLQTMFEDKTRPLYKLCWKLALKRIDKEHYQKHINKAAKINWKQNLDDASFIAIMQFNERHPYYVNKLCDRIFTEYTNTAPSVKQIEKIWQAILAEEKSDAVREISNLSMGQKNLLRYIAINGGNQLTSKQAMLQLQMTSSSIISALNGLEDKDIIEKLDDDGYQIINLVVAFYARK